MKTGVVLSSVAHAAILGFAMVSIGAPKPLPALEVEALPIELVSISEFTRNVKGDRKATNENPPAPKETQRQVSLPAARTVGDAAKDTEVQAEKEAPAPPVEKTEAPTPTPKPEPVKEPEPPKAKPEPKPPEPAPPEPKAAEAEPEPPKPEPKTDIAMLLKENQPVAEPTETQADPDVLKLPDQVAAPKARPTRPAPEAAPAKETDATKKATVNKAETSGGGAKASTKEKAGLGTKKGATSGKLSQSTIDAVRGRLSGCWNVAALSGHPDAAKMRATVDFKLNRDGTIDGRVRPKTSGTDGPTRAILAVAVRSAIESCAPYNLPADKYDTWKEFTVNFSLADML
ncbi:hypothetical protein [Ahrensia sp. R2A130]|uniref:hypothetical protein n=1 Tax=Ahrensia sp. R2A130 TaxID=744979 RepID=UPI0001E0B4C6|nr:hypothetical protein [Ahrensia sp. R2A130]EFL88704.1 TolA protein [Ahrensia sp. R2A130]